MPRARDDFLESVKRALRERVAGLCSAPFCRRPTTGASSASATGRFILGDAAHITAAAPNGPRYDPLMSSQERRSAENGIWLCQKHARAIDADPDKYTVEVLRQWKERAESDANHIALGETSGHFEFVTYSMALGPAGWRDSVPEFMDFIDARRVLGDSLAVETTRMLLELADNALRHGGATQMSLKSTSAVITFSHNGSFYSWSQLRAGSETRGTGGASQLAALDRSAEGRLILGSVSMTKPELTMKWLTEHTNCDQLPCTGTSRDLEHTEAFLSKVEDCDRIDLHARSERDDERRPALRPQACPESAGRQRSSYLRTEARGLPCRVDR